MKPEDSQQTRVSMNLGPAQNLHITAKSDLLKILPLLSLSKKIANAIFIPCNAHTMSMLCGNCHLLYMTIISGVIACQCFPSAECDSPMKQPQITTPKTIVSTTKKSSQPRYRIVVNRT